MEDKKPPKTEDEVVAFCNDMFLQIYKQLPAYSTVPTTAILFWEDGKKPGMIELDKMLSKSDAPPHEAVEAIMKFIADFDDVKAIAFFSSVGTVHVNRSAGQEKLDAYKRDVQAIQAGELKPEDSQFMSPALLATLQFKTGKRDTYICPYKVQDGKNVIEPMENLDKCQAPNSAPFNMFPQK